MTTVTFQGIQFTEKMLADEKTADLVSTYNKIAEANGEKTVNKFSDRQSAIKRTWAMLQKHGKAVKKTPKSDGEGQTRTKRFNYVAIGNPKPVREDTTENPVLRHRLIKQMMTPEGCSVNQAIAIVKQFDKDRKAQGKTIYSGTDTIHTRAYEGMRLVHYYANYSLKQDGEGDDAPVRIVGNRKS